LEGVYDDAANRIYLVKDTVGKDPVEIQTVLAHELTHALDEQNVGPDPFQFHPPLVEAADAEHAVREGSAVLSQARYGIRYLGAFRPVSLYLQTTYPPPSGSRLARLAGEELEFIYASGARFVQALYRRGGWGLVDRALRNPPRTTASILYPRRWPAHDVSVPPAAGGGTGRWPAGAAAFVSSGATTALVRGPTPALARAAAEAAARP